MRRSHRARFHVLSGECVHGDSGTYFEITVHGDPDDPRTDDIVGDLAMTSPIAAGFGLHLIDMNLGMGDLLELVRIKGEALPSAP